MIEMQTEEAVLTMRDRQLLLDWLSTADVKMTTAIRRELKNLRWAVKCGEEELAALTDSSYARGMTEYRIVESKAKIAFLSQHLRWLVSLGM